MIGTMNDPEVRQVREEINLIETELNDWTVHHPEDASLPRYLIADKVGKYDQREALYRKLDVVVADAERRANAKLVVKMVQHYSSPGRSFNQGPFYETGCDTTRHYLDSLNQVILFIAENIPGVTTMNIGPDQRRWESYMMTPDPKDHPGSQIINIVYLERDRFTPEEVQRINKALAIHT